MVTPGADNDAATQPHVVGERDRLPVLPPKPPRLGVDGMRRGEELHARGDLARGADVYRCHVEHHGLDVDERSVADADRAVLAGERRSHDDALANMTQHPAQQRVALVPRAGRGAIEAGHELLRTTELC
jgi:hypothetical protein